MFAILFSVEVQSGGEQVQVCIFHGQSQLRQRCGAGGIGQEFQGHEWEQEQESLEGRWDSRRRLQGGHFFRMPE